MSTSCSLQFVGQNVFIKEKAHILKLPIPNKGRGWHFFKDYFWHFSRTKKFIKIFIPK
jgi:hypothetical protein